MINYQKIYQQTFENCYADEECSSIVPSLLSFINSIAFEYFEDETLTSSEANDLANEFMEKSLNGTNPEIYNGIYIYL